MPRVVLPARIVHGRGIMKTEPGRASLVPAPRRRRFQRVLVAVILIAAIPTNLKGDLVLETETAQLGKQGEGLFSEAMQFERDKDGGTAVFTLNQFEYAI